MNKKDMLYNFIKRIERKKLLTLFIKNIFDYDKLYDYNYLFRVINEKDEVIVDIYDNISENRFNRYIFSFEVNKKRNTYINNNVFITYINVLKTKDSDNKIEKLGYLFNIDRSLMIDYANTFLDPEIVEILKKQANF